MLCDKCNLDKEVLIGAYSKSKGYKQYCGDCFSLREQPTETANIITDSPIYEIDSVANKDKEGNEI